MMTATTIPSRDAPPHRTERYTTNSTFESAMPFHRYGLRFYKAVVDKRIGVSESGRDNHFT